MVANTSNFFIILIFFFNQFIESKKEKINKIRIICYSATFCYQ